MMAHALDIDTPDALITTNSTHVSLLEPDHNTIVLEEMAVSLARQPRYTGHSDMSISIAEHLLICGALAEVMGHNTDPAMMVAILTHDAHEAYTGDIATPVKRLINARSEGLLELIEHRLDLAINMSLGLPSFEVLRCKSVVKEIDRLALACEVNIAFENARDGWVGLPDLETWMLEIAVAVLNSDAMQVADAWERTVLIYQGRLDDILDPEEEEVYLALEGD